MRAACVAFLAPILLAIGLADSYIRLDYEIPTVPAELRQENDCAQFAAYTVLTNMGYDVDERTYQCLLKFKPSKKYGTPATSIPDMMWPWMPTKCRTGDLSDLHEQLQSKRPAIVFVRTSNPKIAHGMVLVGYVESGWILIDARGELELSDRMFRDIWDGRWVELSRREG